MNRQLLKNWHRAFKAIVEVNRTDALVRAIVLKHLDLLVDGETQVLLVPFPVRKFRVS